MTEPQPLSPVQRKICTGFPALGAAMLALGLYLGFGRDAGSGYVFALLGGSAALFAVALSVLWKSQAVRGSVGVTSAPKLEAKTQPTAEPKADVKVLTKIEPKVEAKAQPKLVTPPDANSDIAKLMNTTLGDLLLATYLKDPEGAGRIVAQAMIQAEATIAVKKAPETKAEPTAPHADPSPGPG
jgi:hypothetical protein